MKIYYHDLYRKSTEQESAVDATFCPSLKEVLAVSDCIVLATPIGGSKLITQLITKECLSKFEMGAKFVNIARGTLVDEESLVEALRSGQ
jgi:lactate dehydrogenase-like 2-hydroxyacid dehydrogenase